MTDGYRGVFGAPLYAFRQTDSLVFRSYAVVGSVAAAFTALLFTLALVVLVGQTAGVRGGRLTLSRSFFIVVGLLAVAPMLTPILLVARRHRRGQSVSPGYDRWLGLAGFSFLASLYVGVVVSAPDQLASVPRLAGLLPPLVGAGAIALAHRRLAGA